MTILRDFFLGFIKIHILYHASVDPVYGVEIIDELKRHGYRVSPGLVYPTLHSLEESGYLEREARVVESKVRKYYRITPKGTKMLDEARGQIRELVEEVME